MRLNSIKITFDAMRNPIVNLDVSANPFGKAETFVCNKVLIENLQESAKYLLNEMDLQSRINQAS